MIRGVGVGLDSRNAKEFSWNGVVCKGNRPFDGYENNE